MIDRFEQALRSALNTALSGQCALVIVPRDYLKHVVLARLVQLIDGTHNVRMPGTELHFEGTRGSVRIYSTDNIEYDAVLKRMRGYPHGTPTFLHPEVEGL